MKTIITIIPLLLLISCQDTNQRQENQPNGDREQAQNHDHAPHKSNHGSANEYMHKSSVENLIKRFESPERDEYQQPDKVLEYLGDIDGKTIMDIGAGSGYFSVKLAHKGAIVIAADVDDKFQEYIQQRIKEDSLTNIELRKIPYDSPGLKNREADMVFIVNTYHHMENRPDYFAKVLAGTKDDGELIIIDFFKKEVPVGPPVDHKIAKEVVVDELKQAGYSSIDVNIDLLPYQYIIRAK